ncbi:MAG: ATP-grasp domain-containing protein [Sarcina sp.]
MKILITAVGKRVALIRHLQQDNEIVGVDASFDNACKKFVDKFYKIQKYDEENYIEKLLEICEKEKIECLIPLYEGEFQILLKNKKKFSNIDTVLLASDIEIVELFSYKKLAFEFLYKNKIQTPFVYEQIKNETYPVIVKPNNGMGSKNVFKAKNKKELEFFKEYVEGSIVQEYIEGIEYTVDVLCDLNGNIVFTVPRIRLEVRSGEVSKSRTIRNEQLITKTKEIISIINKNYDNGLRGPLTFQFIEKNDEYYFLELNTRFGGGVPLSFRAGANYSKALNDMVKGKLETYSKKFKEITMYRYDEAVFEREDI